MVIASFTSNEKTILGIRKNNQDIIRVIDSKLFYSDPDKLVGRFYVLISKLFGINKIDNNDKLIFAISGDVNVQERKIIDSTILNKISFQKYFNGFNFIEAFSSRFDENNIHLINDSDCLAFSMSKSKNSELRYPVLSIYIDEGMGVSTIQKNKIINYQSIIRPIGFYDNKNAHQLLFANGLDDLLVTHWENIMREYTDRLIKILEDIFIKSESEGLKFKDVFIFSNKREFIFEDILFSKFTDVNISFFGGSAIDIELAVKGIFDYFDENGHSNDFRNIFTNWISKVEYYSSNDELREEFQFFDKFISHWEAAKPITLGNNFYLINYKDGSKIKIYLNQLNSITDLQKFKF